MLELKPNSALLRSQTKSNCILKPIIKHFLLGYDTSVCLCWVESHLEIQMITNDTLEERESVFTYKGDWILFLDPQKSWRGSGVKKHHLKLWAMSSENTGIECDLFQEKYRGMDPGRPLQRGFCNYVTQDDDKLLLCLGVWRARGNRSGELWSCHPSTDLPPRLQSPN